MEDKFELKKILVSLDLSEMDQVLIRFTSYAARMMHSDRVYFMYIAPHYNVPLEMLDKYGKVVAPADEQVMHILEQQVKAGFREKEPCKVSVEVHEGNPTDRLLKLAKQKDADMLVLGVKSALKGSGTITNKLVQAANRSVLLVPEQLPGKMDKILVPTDFSAHSLRALKQAITIQQNSEIPLEIKCQHVYELPSGWHSTGKSEKEFAAIMCKHAQDSYKKFVKQLPAEHQHIPCVFTLNNDHDPINEIFEQAVREQADLIIIGSRGKSKAASALMGSVSDRLAKTNKSIPLLIVKDKNENIGFLEALFKI